MKVSLVVTVKNEGEAIRPLLDSMIHQSRLPDEVVISDGGSTDNTVEILQEYMAWLPLKIIPATGKNISAGRNCAIAAAAGPIIAVTDCGVVLSPRWVENLTEPIESGQASAVSGWFEPDAYTDFEVVMGSTVLPEKEDIDPEKFLPSSRSVAFLKSAWEAVGGYPEWLDYSEDLVFDLALREKFGTFSFAPNATAYFRPRGSLRSYYRQYYNYAVGDGEANLWPKRHFVRYLVYLVMLPFILRMIWFQKWPGWLMLATGIAAYSSRPAQRLWPNTYGWRPPSRVRAFALIPIIRLVGDIAKMIGYPIGLFYRVRRRSQHTAATG